MILDIVWPLEAAALSSMPNGHAVFKCETKIDGQHVNKQIGQEGGMEGGVGRMEVSH